MTEGLTKTLAALGPALLDEHAGMVALAQGLATACEAEPDNAALWREYRATLVELMRAGEGASDTDTAVFLELVKAPVRAHVRNGKD